MLGATRYGRRVGPLRKAAMITAPHKEIAIPDALREKRLVTSRTMPPRNAESGDHEPGEYRKSHQPPVLAEQTLVWDCHRKPDKAHPREDRTEE